MKRARKLKRGQEFKRSGEKEKKFTRLRRSPKVSRPVRKEKEIYFIEVPGALPPRYFVETAQGKLMWTHKKYLMTESEANLLLHKLKKHYDHKFEIKRNRRKRS